MAVLLVGEYSPTSPHQKTRSTQSLATGSQKDWPAVRGYGKEATSQPEEGLLTVGMSTSDDHLSLSRPRTSRGRADPPPSA
jgi:hypothetical protein